MPTNRTDTAGVIAPPPVIFLAFLLVGWGLSKMFADPGLPIPESWQTFVAISLVGAGLLIDLAAARIFRSVGTRPEPWKPSSALATGGLYRFSRNPMYLGFTLIYLGLAVTMDSAWALGLLVPCLIVMDRFVIQREERYLSGLFGADYAAYRQRVRRWL